MGKPVTIGQSHNIVSVLANNVDWGALDGELLQRLVIEQPRVAGAEFTAFLKNGARMNLGLNILRIDRTQPFNPATFIGQGWSIDPEPQDKKSLVLAEIDLAKIKLVTMLEPGEISIVGEEKLKRLKRAKRISLDARIFQTLWENQDRIPESWKEKVNGNTQYIFFDGTVLRNPRGYRCVLSLYFNGGGWNWLYGWLGGGWNPGSPSAVLASI